LVFRPWFGGKFHNPSATPGLFHARCDRWLPCPAWHGGICAEHNVLQNNDLTGSVFFLTPRGVAEKGFVCDLDL